MSSKKHIESDHGNVTFSCDQCEYTSKWKRNLTTHIASNHGSVERPYPCDHCDFKATTSSGLKSHTSSVHDGVRFNCDICEFITTRVTYLRSHMNSVHNISFEKRSNTDEKLMDNLMGR